MTTITLKKELHKAIDVVENAQILNALYNILHAEIKHTKAIFKPFTADEFYARNEQSQKEIKQGKLIEHKAIKAKYSLK